MVSNERDFTPKVPKVLETLLQVQTGKVSLRHNDSEQSEEIQDLVGIILGLDYEQAKIELGLRDDKAVRYANIHISPLNGRYSVFFSRIPDNRIWQCWYQFAFALPENLTCYYGARRDNLIFSISPTGEFQKLGTYAELMDENTNDRLRKLYVEQGIDAFCAAVSNNDSFNDRFGGDPIKLLRKHKLSIDAYLTDGVFTIIAYEHKMPYKIEQLRKQNHRFVEVWCSDVTFAGFTKEKP